MPRKVLLYIIYGEGASYYDGAKFGILTFLNHMREEDPVEIVVLTESPEQFSGYPVQVISMSQQQKSKWSLDERYHFRIKNRGIAYVMDQLSIREEDKVLFVDADTYFHKNPMRLFDLISVSQSILYLNEGKIHRKRRFGAYVDALDGKEIDLNGEPYLMSKQASMWGSAVIGISGVMRSSIELADQLMLKLIDLVPAHTVEQFSLSEMLRKKFKIVEGKNYIDIYSTSGKKCYAEKNIDQFFSMYAAESISKLSKLSSKVRLKRPLLVIVKQRIGRRFSGLNYFMLE